jgi:nucleoside-diphosphate-sugar epimerase
MQLRSGPRRILVTGGAGFIGSHLIEGLLDLGNEVRVLDNFSTGKQANLEGLGGGRWQAHRDFEVLEGDIRDPGAVKAAVSGMEAILHQAALGSVPRSVEDPMTTQQVNADGTLTVFLAAREAGISRVVYASSSSVYGDNPQLPKREGYEGFPLSPYALTKRVNEDYGRLFRDLYGMETIGLRYFNVYGARQDPESQYAAVIPRFVTALLKGQPPVIYGSGKQSRDFTYVKDVVTANVQALDAPVDACGKGYNIGLGGQTTLLELLETLQALLDTNIAPLHEAPRPGDVMHSSADISLAAAAFGYQPRYDLREGLEEGIDWYRQNLGS